jgi:hypothetical protein
MEILNRVPQNGYSHQVLFLGYPYQGTLLWIRPSSMVPTEPHTPLDRPYSYELSYFHECCILIR